MKYIKIIVIYSFSSEVLERMEIRKTHGVIILSVLLIRHN